MDFLADAPGTIWPVPDTEVRYNICEIWVRDGDLGDGENPYTTLAYDVAGQFFVSTVEGRWAKLWKRGEVDVITRYSAEIKGV